MKYFEIILLICVLLSCPLIVFFGYKSLKTKHFFRLVTKNLLLKSKNINPYFPELYIKQIISFLIAKRQKKALQFLVAGKTSAAANFLKKNKKNFLSLVLLACFDCEKALPEFEKAAKIKINDYPLLAELARIYFILEKKELCKACLENINEKKCNLYVRGRLFYLQSFFDADDGDLLSAGAKAQAATQIFHKKSAFFEEAEAYLLLGIIYRTAVISDVAQLMSDTSLKIFKQLRLPLAQAKVLGNLGMLMAVQKRFEEAEDYYQQASEIYEKHKKNIKNAEILNQQALLRVMQENAAEAQNFANQALEIHQKFGNKLGIAFSKEILAQSAWLNKDLMLTASLAEEAKNIYAEIKNYSAYFENLHLLALALFEQNKLDEAEKILREITKNIYTHSNNFHVANAYNLLGLIYIRKKDFKRAKGLFQQSLDCEQRNNRLSGIATDYVNLGLIEIKAGHIEQAQKTLQLALEYAQNNQDDELVNLIKSNFEKYLVS